MKSAILDLRNNPAVSASMAAEFASDNKASLEGSLGRGATGTDLYMAHFLGLGGARSFLKTMQANPGVSGAAMFPAAARANRSIFYDAGGNARSLGDIYQRFAAKLDKGAAKVGATSLASDTLGGNPGLIPAVMRGGDFETAKANFAAARRDHQSGRRDRHHRVGRQQRQRRGLGQGGARRASTPTSTPAPRRRRPPVRPTFSARRPTPRGWRT